MKKLSGWCRAHRGGLAALAGGGAALLLRKLWVLSNPKILFPLVQTVRCRFDIKLG